MVPRRLPLPLQLRKRRRMISWTTHRQSRSVRYKIQMKSKFCQIGCPSSKFISLRTPNRTNWFTGRNRIAIRLRGRSRPWSRSRRPRPSWRQRPCASNKSAKTLTREGTKSNMCNLILHTLSTTVLTVIIPDLNYGHFYRLRTFRGWTKSHSARRPSGRTKPSAGRQRGRRRRLRLNSRPARKRKRQRRVTIALRLGWCDNYKVS